MTDHRNGYTLSELLVVISIIVVLGLALLVSLNPMEQILNGYDSRRKSDLTKIKIALESYYSDHSCYPVFPLKDSLNRPSYACDSTFLQPYLNTMPCDPNSKKPYVIYLSPAGTVCPQNFAVYAQIFSFFDPNGNKIQNCANTVTVTSAGMNYGEISYGCSSTIPCAEHFGCKAGVCIKLSNYEQPGCTTNYCTSDCGGVNCSFPSNTCQ